MCGSAGGGQQATTVLASVAAQRPDSRIFSRTVRGGRGLRPGRATLRAGALKPRRKRKGDGSVDWAPLAGALSSRTWPPPRSRNRGPFKPLAPKAGLSTDEAPCLSVEKKAG